MKITKRYLKRLIREELDRLIMEDMSQHNTGMTDPDAPFMTTEPAEDRERRQRIAHDFRQDTEKVRQAEIGYDPGPGATGAGGGWSEDPADQEEDARWGMQRRAALQGTDAVRREINSLFKQGHIDKNTWRRARRALYKGDGGESAMQIVGSARRKSYRPGQDLSPGGMADYYARNMEE